MRFIIFSQLTIVISLFHVEFTHGIPHLFALLQLLSHRILLD